MVDLVADLEGVLADLAEPQPFIEALRLGLPEKTPSQMLCGRSRSSQRMATSISRAPRPPLWKSGSR